MSVSNCRGKDIERLQSSISRTYLKKDPRKCVVSGVNFNVGTSPQQVQFYTQKRIYAEFHLLKSLGFTTLRITSDRFGLNEWFHAFVKKCLVAAMQTELSLIVLLPFWSITYDVEKRVPLPIEVAEERLASAVSPYLRADRNLITWDLVNEPNDEHIPLIKIMAKELKKIDSIHRVTIGVDKFHQFIHLNDVQDVSSWHFYQVNTWNTEHPYDRLPRELLELKKYGKPVVVQEFGFPTFFRYPSDRGNTPYNCKYMTWSSPETEKLQRDYVANVLHIVKEADITGYLMWANRDENYEGWGMKHATTQFTRLKPVVNVMP